MYQPYKAKKQFEITEFYSAFEYKCDENYSFSGELHDFWEILIVLDGKLHVVADELVYSISKNQMKFHKPMEFHSLCADVEGQSHYFVVSFNASGDFMDQFSDKVFDLSDEQLVQLGRVLEIYRNEYTNIYDPDITEFIEIISKKPVIFQKFVNSLEYFLIMLSDNNATTSNLIYNDETLLYKKAMKILGEYIYSNISVDNLAKICNVSAAHLKRIFSKYAGIGIHEYFLQLKISHAKMLLADGLSVTDVAETLSFSSQNYFSVVFKRIEGISPLKYKKMVHK